MTSPLAPLTGGADPHKQRQSIPVIRHVYGPLDPRRVLAHARIEALLDLAAMRLPDARRAFDACNKDGPFLDERMFESFSAEYADASAKATRTLTTTTTPTEMPK